MKRLAMHAALMAIVICVVMALAIGTVAKPITPSHTTSGVHSYAHINCTNAYRFLCQSVSEKAPQAD
jgi:hypothetical protein